MFDPWVGEIPWKRTWQPTPVFLPGEFHGQRSLATTDLWVAKSDTIERLTISSSVAPFSFWPQSFPASRSFPVSQFFASGPKYWSFSFRISPFNEYSRLISFRVDWFDLAVQGTLKSLLQNHSLKPSILQGSAFFMVQLSHPYMTTGKTIALTRRTPS